MSTEPAELVVLRALFESFPTAILLANDAAFYVGANRAACALLGRSHDQVVGMHLSDVVAPGRRREVDVQWQAFLRDGVQSGVFLLELSEGTRSVQFQAQANFVPGVHCSFLTPVAAPAERGLEDEPLLTLCAWTKMVKVGDRWVALEQFLQSRLGQRVTHGICPTAFDKLVEEADEPAP
jgi:PAS domain-containing protein